MPQPRPEFDLLDWQRKLDELVDSVVLTEDQELAIQCLYSYDLGRRRIDRIQAVPPARRERTFFEVKAEIDALVARANEILESVNPPVVTPCPSCGNSTIERCFNPNDPEPDGEIKIKCPNCCGHDSHTNGEITFDYI